MRSTFAAVAVVALAATACAGDGAVDAGPVPARPSTTVTTADVPGPTTTAVASEAATTQVSVWFVRGEALEQVARTVPKVPRVGAEAVKALLAGPTAAEVRGGLGTAVPKDTRFRDLVIDGDGIAKVDLSRDFESGGGSLGLTLRLAQVTCTVAQFPTVKGVRFALAGELVSVFSGDGIVLDKPVTCDSYREVLRRPGQTATFAGIWPFATRAELDAYAAGSARTYRDPVATAREFAGRYVGIADPVDFGFRSTGPGAGEVPIGFRYSEGRRPVASPQPTFTVVLRQLGAQDASGPWTVVEATSPNIVVTTPKELDKVASPVRVTGQAVAFEGHVNVEVREDGMLAGQALGRGFVTGGGDVLRPYSGDIAFRAPTEPAGAVVLLDRSAADDQGILRAAVVRVRF
ncbi:MAG: GerMN domain-containing protein [Actinomycetota bacterium]|nr:GerMN domain-containing protein [Actinomycetota bacterium]